MTAKRPKSVDLVRACFLAALAVIPVAVHEHYRLLSARDEIHEIGHARGLTPEDTQPCEPEEAPSPSPNSSS